MRRAARRHYHRMTVSPTASECALQAHLATGTLSTLLIQDEEEEKGEMETNHYQRRTTSLSSRKVDPAKYAELWEYITLQRSVLRCTKALVAEMEGKVSDVQQKIYKYRISSSAKIARDEREEGREKKEGEEQEDEEEAKKQQSCHPSILCVIS